MRLHMCEWMCYVQHLQIQNTLNQCTLEWHSAGIIRWFRSILLDSFSAAIAAFVVAVVSFYRRENTKSRSNSLLLQKSFLFRSFAYFFFYRFMELVVCWVGGKKSLYSITGVCTLFSSNFSSVAFLIRSPGLLRSVCLYHFDRSLMICCEFNNTMEQDSHIWK